MRQTQPSGLENSIQDHMLPDVQIAFHIFSAHWREVNHLWSYPEHTHDLFELNMALKGTQQFKVGERTTLQVESDIALIRPGVIHSSGGSVSDEDMVYFCMHFNIDDPLLRRSLLTSDHVFLAANDPAGAGLRQALDEFARPTDTTALDPLTEKLVSLKASFRILAALCDWLLTDVHKLWGTKQQIPESAMLLASELERQLQEMMQGDQATVRAGIEEMAAQLGYSPVYCNRVFHQVYGMSPRQYLSGLIIRKAKLLLMENLRSVDEVAHLLGYGDVSYFSKQFKRWTGLSPQAYRKLTH
ncbi:MAG: AraC family transcriptional regulator [Gorillibacterium sp.]|nr:AraC family transcriptional regulator [Gorillibacterium sp.]